MPFGQNLKFGKQTFGQASQSLDLGRRQGRQGLFAPALTFGQLFQSPEAQNFFNQEGIARGALQESLRAGQGTIEREASDFAARQGLGAGYAGQVAANARQGMSSQIAQGIAAAKVADLQNRFAAASMLADAMVTAQRAAFMRNLQRRAAQPNFGQMFASAFASQFGATAGKATGLAADAAAGALVGLI